MLHVDDNVKVSLHVVSVAVALWPHDIRKGSGGTKNRLCSFAMWQHAPAMYPALPNWTKDKTIPSRELPFQLEVDRKTQKHKPEVTKSLCAQVTGCLPDGAPEGVHEEFMQCSSTTETEFSLYAYNRSPTLPT